MMMEDVFVVGLIEGVPIELMITSGLYKVLYKSCNILQMNLLAAIDPRCGRYAHGCRSASPKAN